MVPFSRTPPTRAIVLSTVAVSLLAVSPSLAQPAHPPVLQHIVDLWQQNSGLPQNYVSVILQTRDGYIWAGTRSGLARFDGVRFTVYDDRQPGQLKESEVWALAEDADGSLWVGTYGGGLTHLEGGRFTTYTVDDGLPSDLIVSLAVGPDGSLWIGTSAGLARRHHGRFTRYSGRDGLPGGAVRAIDVDKNGVAWFGTDQGLASFSNGRFVNHTAAHPDQLTGQAGAIECDAHGGVWVALRPPVNVPGAVGGGLRLLKDGTITSFTMRDGLPSDTVMSIASLPDGTVWIGTREGLCRHAGGRFDTFFAEVWGLGAQQPLVRASLRGIPSLTTDREGNLWFGTRLDGMGRLREGLFLNITGGDPGNGDLDVRSVTGQADGTLWFGTAHDLRRVHGDRAEIYRASNGQAADALAFDRHGTVLVGTPFGLMYLKAGRLEAYPLDATRNLNIAILFADRAGDVWIGTRDDGAYRLSDGRLIPFTAKEGLLGGQVRGIAQDREGGIWVGTRDGGVSCRRGGRVTTFGQREGISGPAVQALFIDRDDTVWVATRRGLDRIKGNRVSAITARQGLPTNYFYQVIEDDAGHLWMTYAGGIARIAKSELNAVAEGRAASVTAALFGTESGMRTSTMTVAHQPTAWKSPDGRLYFTTAQGVETLDPRRTIRNTIPPPVHIEGLSVDRQPRRLSAPMALEATRGEVEIRYTALSFVAPNRVLFKYWLDGFDPTWVDAGTRRVAYYSNLPHGNYRFRVIACNNDGVWNEAGATLSFEILPLWHERTWVRLLGLALLLCLALGYHRVRMASLRKRERVLAARVSERTRELQDLTSSLERRVSDRTAELASANEMLSAERERLAVTLASIGEGVIATDVSSRVVLMNRAAEQITGWTSSAAAGRPLGEVFRAVDRNSRESLSDLARPALTNGASAAPAGPCLLLARDGREVVVASSLAPIRDPSSRIVGAVLAFRDITERERLDEQLRNTQRLEALGVLAGGIAHDFNNLLTGIFGFVDVARDSASEPERVRQTMERAVGVLEKARGLTRQLLTFSKAGEPVRRPVALGPLVRDAVGFVLSGSNVVAECHVAPDLWPCEVDEQQIAQVVDNLVINARQAMSSGGTVLVKLDNVRLEPDEALERDGGPHVRLSVSDQGPGIKREQQAKIFEPFYTTKAAGTGLGLATVYSIVRRHGGHVEVESEEGAGATFTVFLPASPALARASEPAAVTAAPQPTVPLRARVLVMDDEEYVRDVAGQMLKRLGYEAVLASDDQEAVERLKGAAARGERVDLAILDMTIPGGVGGAEALALLRQVAPGLPAIASSGYSGDTIMARPREHGFDAALPKPYTMANVRAVLSEVLSSRERA